MSVWKMLGNKNICGKVTGVVVAGSMVIGTAVPALAASRPSADLGIEDNLTISPSETPSPSPSPSETPSPSPSPSTNTPSGTDTPSPSNEQDQQETPAPETSTEEPTPSEEPTTTEQPLTQPEVTAPVVPVENGSDVEATADTEDETIVAYPEGIVGKGSDETIKIVPEQVDDIIASLPAGISAGRAGVVLNAYSLIGKVSYFWGGKSYTIGWNASWGNSAYVFSGGSSSSGTYRSYGLDCSGYVAWVFNNAAGYSIEDQVGISTTSQWNLSTPSSKENAMPGDIALFYDPAQSGSMNHIGIIVGWDVDGEPLVAHCSSSKNTVAVTRFTETGFNYVRTPNIYSNETFQTESFNYKNLGEYLLWRATESVEYDDAEAGDLIYSAESSWGGESVQVGKIVGRDIVGNLMVSYTYAEDDDETIKGDEDAETELAESVDTDATPSDATPSDAAVTDAQATNTQTTDTATVTDNSAEATANTDEEADGTEEDTDTNEEAEETKLTIIKPTDEGIIIRSIVNEAAASSYFEGILPITKIKHIFGTKELLPTEDEVQEEGAEEGNTEEEGTEKASTEDTTEE